MTDWAIHNFVSKKEHEQLAKLLRKKRWNKKDIERKERLLAEIKSKARSESEKRQVRIKVLLEFLASGKLVPKGQEAEDTAKDFQSEVQEYLAEQAPELAPGEKAMLPRPVRVENHKSGVRDELVLSLIELVGLQKKEIDYLTEFRRELERMHAHYPQQLENLRSASTHAQLMQIKFPEPSPNRKYELKRLGYHRVPAGVHSIEYEFGGMGEAEWRKSSLSGAHHVPYQPTCLDEIFRGGVGEVITRPVFILSPPITVDTRTNMRRLETLFGMHRNRFPKQLPSCRMGREIVYDWRAVVKIMRALLLEKPRECKGSVRGAPRQVWLGGDPVLRARVLSGIAARVKTIGSQKKIVDEFVAVERRYLPDSAKK